MSEASPSQVRQQLERILESQALNGSDQLKRFLHLVVTRTLDGQADQLKEYNLGQDVFQRPADYDPKVDPIVRVQARRLRTKLDEYYTAEGANDPVVIQIPKGAYVPSFDVRSRATEPQRPRRNLWLAGGAVALIPALLMAARLMNSPNDANRSVAVLPLEMFSKDTGKTYIADEIAEVLTTEIGKSKELRIVSRTTASKYRETKLTLPQIARELGVRWVVEGGVGTQGNHIYVKMRAMDSSTDRKIWADVFDFPADDLVRVAAHAGDITAAAIVAAIHNQESPPASKR